MIELVGIFLLLFMICYLAYTILRYERLLWYLKKDMTDNLYSFNDCKIIKHYVKVIDEVLR